MGKGDRAFSQRGDTECSSCRELFELEVPDIQNRYLKERKVLLISTLGGILKC